MPRIKLNIEYDGSRFCGWQIQKNGSTIQGELEQAFHTIYKKRIVITGSGRTDAGVHAKNQIAHCDIPEITDQKDFFIKLRNSLNGLVDSDIVVKKINKCTDDFHSRYDAKSRIYRYYILKQPSALYKNYSWYISNPLDLDLMNDASKVIKETTEFGSFCKAGSANKTVQCKIYKSRFFNKENILIYQIEANRFLYGMVRAIVGTLLQLGQGKINFNDFIKIVNLQDRKAVTLTAPAKGLFLDNIKY